MDQQRKGESGDRSATTVHVLAGVADLAVSQLARGVRRIGALVGRSDLKEFVRDGHEELRARGELAVNRYSAAPDPHLETLAKRVVARKSRERA